MSNTIIERELKELYPDSSDEEILIMKHALINLFTLGIKSILSDKKHNNNTYVSELTENTYK